jgi:hypothetical protein
VAKIVARFVDKEDKTVGFKVDMGYGRTIDTTYRMAVKGILSGEIDNAIMVKQDDGSQHVRSKQGVFPKLEVPEPKQRVKRIQFLENQPAGQYDAYFILPTDSYTGRRDVVKVKVELALPTLYKVTLLEKGRHFKEGASFYTAVSGLKLARKQKEEGLL